MSNDLAPARAAKLTTDYGVFHAFAGDLITQQLERFGAHTRNELAMVLSHVGTSEVFVDVGAHIGTFAVPVARKLGLRGKLLAIEGGAEAYALLERNVGANGLAHVIQTVGAIAGEGSGQGLRRIDVAGNTGAGFYIPDADSGVGAVDALALVCAYGFARPDFIKIDVEGMELLVLRSLEPIIAARRPKLYIEIAAQQLARHGARVSDIDLFLRRLGYRFYRNTGERNSTSDRYVKTELAVLEQGGSFFDLLALPE